MATTRETAYGLTTDDALRAYRECRVHLLPANNRWKPFLVDHAAGAHEDQGERFQRLCLACRSALRATSTGRSSLL